MKVAVWDTYVQKKDGSIMHFDILVPEDLKNEETIYNFGKDYLATKAQEGQPLTATQCRLCHIENATEEVIKSIDSKGFSIIEMEGCN